MFSRTLGLHAFGLAVGLLAFSGGLSAQSGWQTVKDKTGACQLSVPPAWSVLGTPGHAGSPEHLDTTVIVGRVAFHQFNFSPGMQQVLHIDVVYENSPRRVFYSGKSGGTPAAVIYHVEAPGRMNACIAEIATTPAYPADEPKKIAASLAAVR